MAQRISKSGIYPLSDAEYFADPCPRPSLNASTLKILLADSPAHARLRHPRLTPIPANDNKPAFDLGRAAHALLLGAGADIAVIDADSFRTKDAREARDEAYAAGKPPLLAVQHKTAKSMVMACRRRLAESGDNSGAFNDGQPEQTLIWRADAAGRKIWCRARLDWLPDDRSSPIYDYKTISGSASPDGMRRAIFNFGYDIQAAFYLAGIRAVLNAEPAFRFVFQETEPPYAVGIAEIDRQSLGFADKKVAYGLNLWSRCLAAKRWPAHPLKTCFVETPAWNVAQWTEREAREEIYGDAFDLAG